ncbi:tyrosine-type recombinase/integrase [Parvularcula sp. IMCC14364]|uniref:tyrosine-type recombinase/integrase n=1 Tax=Parvularcula sp. IMCC14364 TaxID=3067902 RepID=UPI002741D4AB|nr:tyrosine-type recombinase/integrase [Parvularcula sp. IMCC14364]
MKSQKFNPENERMKHTYEVWLREACGKSQHTSERAIASVHRFEQHSGYRSFKKLHPDQICAFKATMISPKTGKPLSTSNRSSILADCRGFFAWLASQPGYKSAIRHSDLAYFNLTANEERAAKAGKLKDVPTADEIEEALAAAPHETVVQRRDRALFAFLWLTGARDAAVVSFNLSHVDLKERVLHQLGAEANTKFRKTFPTWFFPVGGEAEQIVAGWIEELRNEHGFGVSDPIFPATETVRKGKRAFGAVGISKRAWRNSQPVRDAVRRIYENAKIRYFTPHRFRDALTLLASDFCQTPEDVASWSQNLGHDDVLTTLTNYGKVHPHRQAELIKGMASREHDLTGVPTKLLLKALGERTQ